MENLNPNTKLYKCSCLNVSINSQQLLKHLRLPNTHKIFPIEKGTSKKYKKLEDDKICKHIKSLRLTLNTLSNRLNLYLVCITYKSLFRITKTQQLIDQLPNSLNLRRVIKNSLISIRMIKMKMIKIERDLEKLKIIKITQFKHFKALTISSFKTFNSSRTSTSTQMEISQNFKYICTIQRHQLVKIYDFNTLSIIKSLNHHSFIIEAIDIDRHSSKIITASIDGYIFFWITETMRLVYYFRGHDMRINIIKFVPSSKHFVTGSLDKTIKVWNTTTHNLNFCIKLEESISQVNFFKIGKSFLFVTDNKSIKKLDFVVKSVRTMKILQNQICCFACSVNYN